MASYFVKRGSKFMVSDTEDSVVHKELPVGVYSVQFSQMVGYYLQIMEGFKLPKKIYGKHTKQGDRIFSTFKSRRGQSTGVLLSGEKGSGKTMLARQVSLLAAAENIPTIVINTEFSDEPFLDFISSITQSCVVMFDEFEKVYDHKNQEAILTLMDGVFQGHKLYLLTCNDKWGVSIHMRNRPGRVFYFLEFKGLEEEFIREYCQDNLKNKKEIDHVVIAASTFQDFNFDMLQALVEEMNRYKETALESLQMLNCKPDGADAQYYDTKIEFKGVEVKASNRVYASPLKEAFTVVFSNPFFKEPKGKKSEDDEWLDEEQLVTQGRRIKLEVQPADLTAVVKGDYTFFKEDVKLTLMSPKFSGFHYGKLLG